MSTQVDDISSFVCDSHPVRMAKKNTHLLYQTQLNKGTIKSVQNGLLDCIPYDCMLSPLNCLSLGCCKILPDNSMYHKSSVTASAPPKSMVMSHCCLKLTQFLATMEVIMPEVNDLPVPSNLLHVLLLWIWHANKITQREQIQLATAVECWPFGLFGTQNCGTVKGKDSQLGFDMETSVQMLIKK